MSSLRDMAKAKASIACVLILGFLIRIYLAELQWVDQDEGTLLNMANMIMRGYVPFRDFMAREPLLLYILAVAVKLLGPNLSAMRMATAACSMATAFILYKIGKEVCSERAGLLASFIYAFSPYTVYTGLAIAKIETTVGPFVAGSIYFMILGIRRNSSRLLCATGLLIAAATLVRRDSALLFIVGAASVMITKTPGKMQKILAIVASFSLAALPPILFFAQATSV